MPEMILMGINFAVISFFCLIVFRIMYGDVFFNEIKEFGFWVKLVIVSLCLTGLITVFEIRFLPW